MSRVPSEDCKACDWALAGFGLLLGGVLLWMAGDLIRLLVREPRRLAVVTDLLPGEDAG